MTLTGQLAGGLRSLALRASRRARAGRGRLFLATLAPTAADRILDLGSEDGAHMAALVPFREHLWIADIDPAALARGRERFGFQTLQLDESGRIPVPDDHFDIVFCSSVLEHVTVDKADLESVRSRREFERRALDRQRRFAHEIARVARHYFVQTPYRYFPLESHTWLPAVVVFLPRPWQLRFVAWTNRWWIKTTSVDFHLLTRRQMAELFPGAEIVGERFFGMTKSLVAIRR